MRVFRALSLDVVAGAACGGLLAEYAAQTRMLPGWWVALLAAVWSIYTGDHLLDARRHAGAGATADRYQFHSMHERSLTVALALVVLAGLGAALTLRPSVRVFGIALSIAVIGYLASAQGFILPTLPKEPAAGVLYAAGIWGGPIVLGQGPRHWLIAAASLHAVAAILNLTMLGIFEADLDRRQGARSLARRFGPQATRWALLAVSGFGVAVALSAMALGRDARSLPIVFLILAMQMATPAILLAFQRWSAPHDRYRIWGDSIFLLGALPRFL